MHLFSENGNIKKFDTANNILKYWFNIRLEQYTVRKNYIIEKLSNELNILKYKAMFIEYVITEKLIIFKRKKKDI